MVRATGKVNRVDRGSPPVTYFGLFHLEVRRECLWTGSWRHVEISAGSVRVEVRIGLPALVVPTDREGR